ncbi:unnamed protein product [Ixodes pacificus]
MVNFAKAIAVKVWRLVLGFFGVVRRAFCCFRRRRRASDIGLPVSVSDHGISIAQTKPEDFQNWGSWNEEDGPTSVMVDVSGGLSAQPGASSQRSANGSVPRPSLTRSGSGDSQRDPEDDMDFFKDMTPRVVRQKKYVPRVDDSLPHEGLSSRLKFDAKAGIRQGSELGVLEDEVDTNTWEDLAELEDSAELTSAIREKRQAERERRMAEHQRKKQEKELRRASAGTRVRIG